MTTLTERNNIISLVTDGIAAGARQRQCCTVIALSERTLQRWQRDARSEDKLGDQRSIRIQAPKKCADASRAPTDTHSCQFRRIWTSVTQPNRPLLT